MITTSENYSSTINQYEAIISTAFFKVTSNPASLHKQATRIAEDVAFKLHKTNKVCHRLHLRAWNSFGIDNTYSFDIQIGVNDAVILLRYVKEMLDFLFENPIMCHGLSFTVAELKEDKVNFCGDTWGKLSSEMAQLKMRFGQNMVRFAAAI
jgi:hypothetical protein